MLLLKDMTERHVQKILDLVEAHTMADVAARMGTLPSDVYSDTLDNQVEALDNLRKFIFGTSDLVELAYMFGVYKRKSKKVSAVSTKKKVKKKVVKSQTQGYIDVIRGKKKKKIKKKVKRKVNIRDESDNILSSILR